MKKQLAFRPIGFSVVLIAEVFALLGCNQSAPGLPSLNATPSPQWTCNKEFTPVLNDGYSGFSSGEFRLIDNASDWCQVWGIFFGGISPTPPCDTKVVDFSREVAILAAMGQVSTGGFTVQITCIQVDESPDDIRVLVSASVPEPGCDVTAMISSPATVVKVDRPVQRAVFKTNTIVEDCTP